ncbi:hypothetical protein NDU88_000166 [Pleurodeles waltl]|uniref:Uncharacterized protein n=1 Tax=Pleurodeles waltl TaxID=8319 RepID=A0AAV7R539_PLEWA|nr:hypothetical protein NDU88_000166 [Pleurodeles waltl]
MVVNGASVEYPTPNNRLHGKYSRYRHRTRWGHALGDSPLDELLKDAITREHVPSGLRQRSFPPSIGRPPRECRVATNLPRSSAHSLYSLQQQSGSHCHICVAPGGRDLFTEAPEYPWGGTRTGGCLQRSPVAGLPYGFRKAEASLVLCGSLRMWHWVGACCGSAGGPWKRGTRQCSFECPQVKGTKGATHTLLQ